MFKSHLGGRRCIKSVFLLVILYVRHLLGRSDLQQSTTFNDAEAAQLSRSVPMPNCSFIALLLLATRGIKGSGEKRFGMQPRHPPASEEINSLQHVLGVHMPPPPERGTQGSALMDDSLRSEVE